MQSESMMCGANPVRLSCTSSLRVLSLSLSCVSTERSGSLVVASMCTCNTCVHIVRNHVCATVLWVSMGNARSLPWGAGAIALVRAAFIGAYDGLDRG